MKIAPEMNLDKLADCFAARSHPVTDAQAIRMRDLLNRDANTYGWKSTNDVEDTDWFRMQDEVISG